MRAMILGAGLGTRLRPLSELRPKPALPVRGLPVVAYQLALLRHHGVREVAINTHHLPALLERAAREHCPPDLSLHFSHEAELLDTGGGIRNLAGFLAADEVALILAGDMLLDADLGALVEAHRSRGNAVTVLLRDDPRAATFGSIGIDAGGRVRRIGRRFDLGGEVRAGVYAHATVVSAAALDTLPDRQIFGHLDHWLMPRLADGARDIGGLLLARDAMVWEPIGTPAEYLAANLEPAPLSYLDADAAARRTGVRFEDDVVIGAGARLGRGVHLERAVVWDGETVPDGFRASNGVFAGGAFHRCDQSAGENDA
jgi:NDP-sugar pyrophosphorylase family protein